MIFKEVPRGVEFPVKVVPGSAKAGIVGLLGDALKVAVNAPPEKGKANQALVKLLVSKLGLSKQSVMIASGHRSPRKTILVEGVTPEFCRRKLLGDAD